MRTKARGDIVKKKIAGVYVAEFKEGIKFGYTQDIKKRMRSLNWVKSCYILECQYPKFVESEMRIELDQYYKYFGSVKYLTGVSLEYVLSILRRLNTVCPPYRHMDNGYKKKVIRKIELSKKLTKEWSLCG